MASPDPPNAAEVLSILVFHQGALGDFILALPALEALRKTFPHAKSVIMGYPRILELVHERFYADKVFSVDQKGMASFFMREGNLDFTLSEFFKTFDLIVVFGKDGEGTLAGNLKRVNQGRIFSINSFPRWDEKVHMTDHLLKQFDQYGIPPPRSNPRLCLKKSDLEWAKHFWESKGVSPGERSKLFILHPGSGSKRKAWPLDRFLTLARTLQDRLRTKVLVVLGPAEEPDVWKAFEKAGLNGPVVARGLTLLQLASAMDGCGFFVGNDSGISHMAAALGLPTLAIFGPTDQEVWSPRGEEAIVVSMKIHCSPCSQERFVRCRDSECLRAVEVKDVLAGLEGIGIPLKSQERRRKMEEKKIGEVIKYFGKIGVAAIRLSEGSLKVGETIHIVGHTTDITQGIDSMQIENKSVQEAGPGADIGIKIKDRVREHDVVYKVGQ